MANHPFERFIGNEPKGAKKKEAIKVEKRKAKKEAKAIGDQKRREKWEKLHGVAKQDDIKSGDFKRVETKKTFGKASKEASSNKPVSSKKNNKSTFSGNDKEEKPVQNSPRFGKRPVNRTKTNEDGEVSNYSTEKKDTTSPKKFSKQYITSNSDKYFKGDQEVQAAGGSASKSNREEKEGDEMPLNKFIAHAGVCGRREAAQMVKDGLITVNGDVVYEPGYKVYATDNIVLKGKKLVLKKNLVYILLNKPKDYLTTSSDPNGRKTVLDLVKEATKERVYPVGRLDRNTTGVLIITNDGELAQKLTHPGYQIKKVYAVKLDKALTKKDFDSILAGLTLEDGTIQADSLGYTDAKDKTQIGIEIHSGRNRIVRRIFEHLGYEVKALDRVMFASLTKKNVERGTWRFLAEKEVRLLKYLNQGFIKKDYNENIETLDEE